MAPLFDRLNIRLFLGIFSSICEEMGSVLQRTAFSPNICERRDFSCALFDAKGDLVAQAAHIPVHLGSAQESVKLAIETLELLPGDMAILNDPYRGGTHLPDITVIAPIYESQALTSPPAFYVCNRAHHADVGGKSSGSLPLASHIEEEGLCLAPTLLVRNNQTVTELLHTIMAASRTPEERRGDLLAQVSANKFAQARLQECISRYSLKLLRKHARQLQLYSQTMMLAELKKFPRGEYTFEDYLEAPSAWSPLSLNPSQPTEDPEQELIRIAVKINIREDGVTLDFSDSAAQNQTSLNTVLAVTRAAALYVFCALAEDDIPINSGCLEPIKIIAPAGSILNARYPAAVSAGNVETSQRIVDVLLGALAKAVPERVPAASCGSMNNLCIGGRLSTPRIRQENYAYYETIAGGQGASPNNHGADAIHTHMTNTLNTPIEALEHAYPFQIESYAIRKKSGGKGKFHGGEGIERSYFFIQPAEVTIISDRRLYPPYGMAGGGDGATGENILERDGKHFPLPGKCTFEAAPNDILRILTPGGGAYGKPS